MTAASAGSGGASGGSGGLRRGGLIGRLGLNVDRQHQHDRPALCDRALVRARGIVGGCPGAVDPVGDRADRLDQVVLVDPEVRGQRRRGRLAGEDQHGRAALGGFGEAGHRVRQAGPLVDADHADAAGGAGVAVGHAGCAHLVPGGVEGGAVPDQRVGHDEVAAPEHAEGVLDPLGGDRGADDVGDR